MITQEYPWQAGELQEADQSTVRARSALQAPVIDGNTDVRGNYTVLVIEDDLGSRALAASMLEHAGYRVIEAASGLEGIALFNDVRPCCVLLDVRMPSVDGYETCRRLRALPGGREVPIVLMTAERSVDTFDSAFACGADDFLTKPLTPRELLERVHAALGLWRVRAALHDYELVKMQRDQLVRDQLQNERMSALLVHDLKAPLNTISLLAQGLLRGKTLSDTDRGMVEDIWMQARDMASMVLDLLDIGMAREGKLVARRERVELQALLDRLATDFAPSARSRGVTLETRVSVQSLHADTKLLRRLLANLIDNALRYAPAGSRVQVIASPRPGGVEVRVIDDGPGIPLARRQEIFEAFSQAGESANDSRGLGLTFCRLAARAHGGNIRIEDAPSGCVICVELPQIR